MRTFQIFLAATAVLLSAGHALAQAEVAEATPGSASEVVVPVRAMGREDAPVRIDLYSAFNCAECAAWYLTVLPEVRSRYIDTGQARLIFHDVAVEPIQYSVRSAMVGLCADPAHFFEVAQSFMEGQAAVIEDGSEVTQWFSDARAVAGRDPAEVEACAASEATYNMVVAQNSHAMARALPALPGVVVNGRIIPNPTIEGIAAAILFGSMASSEPEPSAR